MLRNKFLRTEAPTPPAQTGTVPVKAGIGLLVARSLFDRAELDLSHVQIVGA